MLMEQISCNMLFRWFVGLAMDDAVWDHSTLVNARVTPANGTAERDTAAGMLADVAQFAGGFITVDADKNCDTASFVATRRANGTTPHMLQNDGRVGGSSIDGRTTRWPGYAVSQCMRKCIEQVFGWSKTVGGIRQAMYWGLARVDQLFPLTRAAYNLTRMRTLATRAA